jgi:hypothetical protein
MTAEDIQLQAQAFRQWHAKQGGEPYRAFRLWAASKALRKADARLVWAEVCRLGVAR